MRVTWSAYRGQDYVDFMVVMQGVGFRRSEIIWPATLRRRR